MKNKDIILIFGLIILICGILIVVSTSCKKIPNIENFQEEPTNNNANNTNSRKIK